MEIDNIDNVISQLVAEEVPCHDVRERYNVNGIAFPSGSLDHVLRIIGKQNVGMTLEPTGIENMLIVRLEGEFDGEFRRPPGGNFEGWDYLVPVLKHVYSTFGVRVISDSPHGAPQASIPDTNEANLHIHFWSTPVKTEQTKMKSVFGIRLVGSQRDALKPSGIGTAIIDNEGNVVAEYYNNNLYILFDLPHASGEGVTEMFSRIIGAYFVLKGRIEDKLTHVYYNMNGITQESSKDLFVRSCNRLYESQVNEMERKLAEHDRKINDENVKLIADLRDREVLAAKLEPLKTSSEARKQWAGSEYDALCASEHVKDVRITDKVIHVYTDMIQIRHKGTTYNIGEFKIDIHTDGSEGGVRVFNLTRPIAGQLAHPHIKIDGHCCLGNIKEGVHKLLAEYQYVVLAQLMITFLQSYNSENPYGRVTLWE
ncbi:MAG: hypothetical protein WC525_10405 [Candidatus Thermoplasmatota archaeon]